MPVRRIAVGRPQEAIDPDSLRAALAEFISTLIFVFAGEGACMAYAKLTGHAATSPEGLLAVALAHALGFLVAVAVSANLSGGHVNPAVTFGALIGGHLSVLRAFCYWIAQLVGAVVASLLLKFTTGGLSTSASVAASAVGAWNAVVLEIVLTFGLVYTVYATSLDPKRGSLGTIGPLAIGFVVGANMLAGGPFDGASMNPARAFGPALVSWTWRRHWVYWVGPFIGGGLAGLVYEWIIVPSEPAHQPLGPDDY